MSTAFEPVRRVFAANFSQGHETGAGLCVIHRGQVVLNLHDGLADPDPGRPWTADTLVPLTSITKTVLATLVLLQAQAGALDLSAPIARYWPEFGAHGKSEITLMDALSHQAGIPAFSRPVTLSDQIERQPVLDLLTELTPRWTPGTAHGYHAITLGFVLTEVLRRVTGTTERPLVRELLSEPLGLDLYLGLDAAQVPQVATIIPPADTEDRFDPTIGEYCASFKDPTSLFWQATFGSSAMSFADMNDLRYFTVERPAAGYATARAVAGLFAALIGAGPAVAGRSQAALFGPDLIKGASAISASGKDRVFSFDTAFGRGYMLPGSRLWSHAGPGSFGHIGSTGGLAFADPANELAFAYLPTRMKHVYEFPDRRATALVAATYAALGQPWICQPPHRRPNRPNSKD